LTTLTVAVHGPYSLDSGTIDSVVTGTSPGVYVLADAASNVARRVGRSDMDVRARLKTYVGKYHRFWFAYAGSPKEAFEKECHLWHDLKPADNIIHPDRPSGCGWRCPVCPIFN
jgi:excinuclease UvrABC nuclease subunit